MLSHGETWITSSEASEILGLDSTAARVALARLTRRRLLFSPTRGGYVAIPPEFRTWGVVPATHFVDQMMSHLGHAYYLGLLSAAEVHGAAHQRPQVSQIVTDARLRRRCFGRVCLEFVTDRHVAERPIVTRNTPTGTMRVSTPEVTVLDLVTHPRHSGGLSNIATIAGELIQDGALDPSRLTEAVLSYPLAVVQRSGWLLDEAARQGELASLDLAELERIVSRAAIARLAPGRPASGDVDRRWRLDVNSPVKSDL